MHVGEDSNWTITGKHAQVTKYTTLFNNRRICFRCEIVKKLHRSLSKALGTNILSVLDRFRQVSALEHVYFRQVSLYKDLPCKAIVHMGG